MKRIFIILLAMFLFGGCGTNNVKKGDVNGDGVINEIDIDMVNNNILGIQVLTGKSYEAADIDNDERITINDLVIIQKKANE